ncbi:hypothetical protein SAMN04488117_104226 [Celeribacter baekdonensis]|uniref:Glycerophosphoryl diester phosphodiesterase membrane domain-containing protein n=1 Tax=Celeribacter baekdonensis TaxID=875171 RepID=A0A1G7LBH8_9RHOB|nr:hypothetical protein [Celeribacter baekdonensis]SDF46400.1 hypothetical protein SAMN04488117_104226 [Celeribacter baekdonensis]
MTGFQLFQHAILRVFRNLDEALAVSGLIWIAILVCQILAFGSLDMEGMAESDAPMMGGSSLLLILLSNVVMAVGSCWVAVEWHRYVLEGKRPTSAFPSWSGSRVWGYFGVSLLIGLLIGLFVGILAAFLVSILGSQGAMVLGGLFLMVVIGLPAIYGFLRVSPVLPEIALGGKMRFAEAWSATKPHSATILQAAILSIVSLVALQILGMLFGNGLPGLIYELVTGWIVLMVNVSLLSSIYEISVRGRLDD